MLILTRRLNEVITIGDDIKIQVLGIKGSQVRIGVAAPNHVAVHREEIRDRIEAEKRASASAVPGRSGTARDG